MVLLFCACDDLNTSSKKWYQAATQCLNSEDFKRTLKLANAVINNFAAKHYYEKACNLGEARGCNVVAFLYTKGLGTRKNLKTAKEYYGRACDLGSQRGFDNHNNIKESDIILGR